MAGDGSSVYRFYCKYRKEVRMSRGSGLKNIQGTNRVDHYALNFCIHARKVGPLITGSYASTG